MTRTFEAMFRAATGHGPLGYTERVARDGLPDAVTIPQGAGRTGIILAWLYRRLASEHATPRRLVYALPQGALTEPVANQARSWLANLKLTDDIALHVAGGDRDDDHGDWREDMHKPAIIVGTADILASKALNRGYDTGRAMAPIDFALLTNGAHWVVHEARLCPRTVTTLRQLAVFAKRFTTAEPFGLTLVSATVPGSPRGTRRLAGKPGDYPGIAAAVRECHRPGQLTLVVLNTVEAAQAVYAHLPGPGTTLLHSRFRGIERAPRVAGIAGSPADRIVVCTKAVEAGLDLDAATVIAEEDRAPGRPAGVLSSGDFAALFDTSADADIAPYVSDSGDLDAEVAWATWTPGEGGAPDPEIRVPSAGYRCRVPLTHVTQLAKDRPVWRSSQGEWVPITAPGEPPAQPGELLLVHAADGGYTPETGFDRAATEAVEGIPEPLAPEQAADTEPRPWQSLDEHSTRTRDQAAALLKTIKPGMPNGSSLTVPVAAFCHDAGKAHEIWQDALCALAPSDDAERIAAGRPWAKSGGRPGRLEFASGPGFCHEFASLLLIDGPLRALLARAPDPDLARYLVLAHHGRLRVQVRDPAEPDGRTILGLAHGAVTGIPPMLGHPATTLTVDLAPFAPDGAWTRTVLSLRDRYGPFVLAYAETLVRIADWRASGGRELPG